MNSPEETFFYRSIDASELIKTGAFLWEQLDNVVAEIGGEHVIQVIIENHASYVITSARLMDTRECPYWTSFIAHYINLMLEDRENLEMTKGIAQFIYNHC